MKTIFVNVASGDESEDRPEKEQEMIRSLVQGGESMLVDEADAQSPEQKLVQVVHGARYEGSSPTTWPLKRHLRMPESYSEFWSAEKDAPKRRRLDRME